MVLTDMSFAFVLRFNKAEQNSMGRMFRTTISSNLKIALDPVNYSDWQKFYSSNTPTLIVTNVQLKS